MVNDSPVHLTLCDTAGQDTLDPLRELCYPDSDVFLLCFSVAKPETFHAIKTKWAPKFAKTKASLMLVGTQADLRTNSNVLNKLQVSFVIILLWFGSVRFVGSIAVSAIYTRANFIHTHTRTQKISSNKTIQLKVNRKFRNFVILERICYQIIMTMTGNRNRTPTPTMTMLMMMMLVEAQKKSKAKIFISKSSFSPRHFIILHCRTNLLCVNIVFLYTERKVVAYLRN